jgi:anti-sigma regulatory factor (Ser/Thr protein kinase)
VPYARLRARHLAREWGLAGMAETIELLVSELTTNSVQAMAGQDGQPIIRLRLLADSARVRIEVWDVDPRPPAPNDSAADGTPDLQAESGRGLLLVAALSTRWAWYATREPMGKVAWCELDLVQLESHLRSMDRLGSPPTSADTHRVAGSPGCRYERSGYLGSAPRWAP